MQTTTTTDFNVGPVDLTVDLEIPATARGVVIFAHGAGSSRLSPRNRAVAAALRSSGMFGTMLFDLLAPEEDVGYANRFDIELLTGRLVAATEWLTSREEASGLPVSYFGASTGAAAALMAAARLEGSISSVVSRGGRPDLAAPVLRQVTVPTLLIVGGRDTTVIEMNEMALGMLGSSEKQIEIVPGATHLFEEPGAMDQVVKLTLRWFERHGVG